MILLVATETMGYMQSVMCYHSSSVIMRWPLSKIASPDTCMKLFQRGVSFRITLPQKLFASLLLMATIKTLGTAMALFFVKTVGHI
jgi:hypothetical protein